ncbi:MAG: Bifunctional phosphoglucose/phosphomannose isomerase [Candidatus Amesbacteria bacterium GW2011_GWA2_47_11b]|uniref:Bifunctional phosphoglucose/phosphomannose isomerase n=1 Tax=Candidatus Amesbacteria bacterium GW2011_GWA2_47_11b TaxID=1618358 RepID=A0A0G1TTR2_9BACT|nr:MAG: Bifunctional phosphoglucose/phosphomannose isomerase [Candidatus Amesbacteria bacterium GW2011_GWA2_47_11b]
MNWKSSSSSTPIIKYENTAKEMYLDMLKKLADTPYSKWTVVVDTANGTQSEIIFDLLDDLKIKYVKTGDCDIQSPYFVPRDTEVSSSFAEISRQVVLNKADLGIAFDVDGDRIIFIDDQGKYLPGDYSCTLIAKSEVTTSIVTPISTSSVIDSIGKTVYRTPVGSTHVAAKMKEVGAKFGFEPNGGGIFADIAYGRDGGVTLIKMLNILKKSKKKLSGLIAELPKYHLFREKTDCPFDKFQQIYDTVREKYSNSKITDLDGIKVDLGQDEWILFRGSGNAPEFRVFVQSSNVQRAQRLGQEGLSLVKSLLHRVRPYASGSGTDSLNILGSIQALPDQCAQVISEIAQATVPSSCSLVNNIVISGMGGSALGGRVMASLERQTLRVPIAVSTEYHLPNFANEKTLVVISSYSGQTEETLSVLAEARARGCQIFILTAGGKLAEFTHLPHYIFNPLHNPSGQPRMSLGYEVTAMLALLARCQLIHPLKELSRLPEFLRSRQNEVSSVQRLASSLVNKIPVFLVSEHLKGAVHAMKNQLNENAKTFAVVFDLPEANHHLMEGLAHPQSNPDDLAVVLVDSPHYHPEVRKRYPLTRQVIAKHHIPVFDFPLAGPNPLFEALDVIQSGAYLAYYLSQEYGIDPGPIPWVDWFKDELH